MKKIEQRKKAAIGLFLFLIFICLCSCASRPADKRLFVHLTDKAKYVLLHPDGIEKPIDMAQYISASFMGQDYSFNAWVRADNSVMDITLVNEMGAAMGELFYADGIVNFSSRVFPDSLPPEYIVADFQLCFYDPVLLRRALKECGLSLETQNWNGGLARRVFSGRDLIIEIERRRDRVKLVNHLRGYAYTLEGDFE